MTQTVLIESQLQARVQAATDRLADVLAEGGDSTDARAERDQACAALQAHQQAEHAAGRQRKAAEAAEADQAVTVAVAKATSAVAATVERVQLPAGVEGLASTRHPLVAEAAGEVARIRLELERSAPAQQKAAAEVAALTKRADSKRLEAASIRSRRLAGHEEEADAAKLHLLEADAAGLDDMVRAAQQRLHLLNQANVALGQRLAEAEKRLAAAQVDAELHGQADRVRALEAAFVEGVRALRSSLAERKQFNLPSYYAPTKSLRDVSLGLAP